MRILVYVLAASIFFLGGSDVAAADIKAGEKAAAVCAACHGIDGNKSLDASYPKLAGQYADYLVKAMKDYRSGARGNLIMKAQAANLSDADIENLAAWYAAQKSELRDLRDLK